MLHKFYRILLLTALVACAPAQADPVEVRLSTWPSHGKNAPFYFGLAQGLFRSEGIDLKIVNTFQNTLSFLEAGQADVAQVFLADALDLIAKGRPLRVLAVRDSQCPIATVSRRGESVKSLRDYENRKWAISPSFFPEGKLLPGLSGTLFDHTKVQFVHVEFSGRLAALLRKDVDVFSAWWGSGYPIVEAAAQAFGAELSVTKWTELGIECYGEVFVVKEEWLKNSPSVARGFLTALAASIVRARSSPDDAMASVVRAVSIPVEQRAAAIKALQQSFDTLGSGSVETALRVNKSKLERNIKLLGLQLSAEQVTASLD